MGQLIGLLSDPQFIVVILIGIATFATVLMIAGPMMSGSKLNSRMKSVSTERDKLRAKRLAELAKSSTSLRHESKGLIKEVVEKLKLERLLAPEEAKIKLRKAGLRGPNPLMMFMFFQMVMPILVGLGVFLYMTFVNDMGHGPTNRLAFAIGAAAIGYYLPNIFVSNIIQKRQSSIQQAFPDALDLLLICVQSGMSIEAAFKLVSNEIGAQSIELAEELTLTTAEMSYLQERRMAYENLSERTGLDSVKAVCGSLIQAERYGTPLSQSLRVLAQESRDSRMAEAERKAAALPPKLTVPMIAFFLPVLFVVILGPAIIQVMGIE
jgi:tight adherence protein C